MINTVRKKAPNPVDQHVGSRVRMRRAMLAMSQTNLGNALGLTFQQVQKYEKGTNRIGASIPFASPHGLFNLSKLSVWWLRLGIAIERIKPGHPQQNGRHERMHLTLKKETTRPSAMNSLQQQAKFDAFVLEFNCERPHEALAMKCPAEIYTPSPRVYNGLPEL